MDLYLVTGNKNKKMEIERMMNNELKIEFVDFDLIEIQSDNIIEINEHKVKNAFEMLNEKNSQNNKKQIVITEDTGLYIDCLNFFPGPFIKWMQKAIGSKGIYEIVSKFNDNKCHAICVYSIYDGENVHSFKGVTHGKIVEPRGSDKFSWDNIFLPNEFKKTFAEMTFCEKKEISPRFKAFVQLKGEIEDANNLWRQALKECIKYSMRGYPTTKNRDMQISLRLNLSLYHFKKNELSECINQCNIILENLMNLNDVLNYYENNKNIEKEINEINKINEEKKDDTISENKFIKKDTLIKIFLRRANSFLCLQDFDKCRENIELIKRLDNKNVEMIALEKKMKIEEVDYNKKQKELYKKMCNTIKKKEKE